VVIVWLWIIASQAKPGTDQASARLDAVRTGLAAGAGAGAAVGLVLAFRRQHHQEIATVLTDLDATERRITELYTRATEQLGSDKAPVRLGGLYAFERLAQDNPTHRQTIVNVICAYLRMPFSLPENNTGSSTTEWDEEKQVRLTAQRILSSHLSASHELAFWPDISLDLTAATLIQFEFNRCKVAGAQFEGAVFSGFTKFGSTAFSDDVNFNGASFTDMAIFSEATFLGSADFNEAKFSDLASFSGVTFSSLADFYGASFSSEASFVAARFSGGVGLDHITFAGNANFARAISANTLSFHETVFSGTVSFTKASLSHGAELESAHVQGDCKGCVWPAGWRLGNEVNGTRSLIRDDQALGEASQ
jgi:uncharacterized protein YjbI with pentapeptide repeats